MPDHWQFYLAGVFNKLWFQELSDFIEKDYNKKVCYPSKENIFKIFDLIPLKEIKVVILGQDPYHGAGQAQGLSFSVPKGLKLPPSLRNIYKEITSHTQEMIPISGDLNYLAHQGVFLLNTILTVEENKPGSHQKKGWEVFSDEVIMQISAQTDHLVFLLWGNYAQKKAKLIDSSKHLILTAGHPSPMSANQGKWFGNNHFEITNSYLMSHHKTPIKWINDVF